MNNSEQQFLKELDVKLWSAADRLRNNLDAANWFYPGLADSQLRAV